MRQNINIILSALVVIMIGYSCQKVDDYKKYQTTGETIFPGIAVEPKVFSGRNRIMIAWVHGADSRTKKYLVQWNDGTMSKEVDVSQNKSGDTVKVLIENLNENVYNFQLTSLDSAGNKSIKTVLRPSYVYGNIYESGLLNRVILEAKYEKNVLTIQLNKPDTIYLSTKIYYTNLQGTKDSILTAGASDATKTITNWKQNTPISWKSSYIPVRTAIDTFRVQNFNMANVSVVSTFLWLPGDYQTPNKWMPNNTAVKIVEDKNLSKYHGFIFIPSGGDNKFKITRNANWDVSWGDKDGDKDMDLAAEPNMTFPSDGHYYVTADLTTSKWNHTKITTWGIIGAATPGKMLNSTPIMYNSTTKKWIATINLTPGSFRFRANNANILDLAIFDPYGTGALRPDRTPLYARNADGFSDIMVSTAGNYTVTLDLNDPSKLTYTLTKN